MERRAPRAGRPKELKGVGKPTMLYLDNERLTDFKRLCEDEYKISMSEGLRQLIEQELEKNETGLNNPTNIQYGLRNKFLDSNSVSLTLDKFLDSKDLRKVVETIPEEHLGYAFSNSKKLNQQIQLRQNGKITI